MRNKKWIVALVALLLVVIFIYVNNAILSWD